MYCGNILPPTTAPRSGEIRQRVFVIERDKADLLSLVSGVVRTARSSNSRSCIGPAGATSPTTRLRRLPPDETHHGQSFERGRRTTAGNQPQIRAKRLIERDTVQTDRQTLRVASQRRAHETTMERVRLKRVALIEFDVGHSPDQIVFRQIPLRHRTCCPAFPICLRNLPNRC